MGAVKGTSSEVASGTSVSKSGFEVLWAGEKPVDDTLRALLGRGAHVRIIADSDADACAEEVVASAPDLLIFSGTSHDLFAAVWSSLRRRAPFAMVPVALVGQDATSSERLRRTGVIARLSASLAPESLADELHALLCALVSRRGVWGEGATWDELDDWLTRTARDGGCGFLMSSEPTAALVLGPDGPIAPPTRMIKQASRAKGPRSARFVDFPSGRLRVLREAGPSMEGSFPDGTPVLVVHPVPERRAALSEALKGLGAQVHAVSKAAEGAGPPGPSAPTDGVHAFEPTLIVVAAPSLMGPQAESLWRDARFASCSWVVLDETAPKPLTPQHVAHVAASLAENRHLLRARLELSELMVGRIESFRASGWLSVLSATKGKLSVVLEGASGCAELELHDGIVATARFRTGPDQAFVEGAQALENMSTLSVGRILAGSESAVSVRRAELAVPRLDVSARSLESGPRGTPSTAPTALGMLGQKTAYGLDSDSRLRKHWKVAVAIGLGLILTMVALCTTTPSSPLGADAARFERAKRAVADTRYGDAQPILSELVGRHPANFELRYDLALSQLKLHRLKEAHSELDRARALDEEAPQVWFLLGDIRLEEQDTKGAIEAWRHCLELRRGYLPCQERLAQMGVSATP